MKKIWMLLRNYEMINEIFEKCLEKENREIVAVLRIR